MEYVSALAIATPYVGYGLPEYYVRSIWGLQRGTIPVSTFFVANKPVDVARNKLTERILDSTIRVGDEERKFSHVLWMDSDMEFPPDMLRRLLAHEKPIVSATYFSRTDMPIPHVYQYFGVKDDGYTYYTTMGKEFSAWLERHPEWKDRPNIHSFDGTDGLVECDGVGFGAVLVRREVLEAVGYPWFEADAATGGAEDFDFCEKAKRAGFPVFADFAIQCNHAARDSFIGRAEFADCWGPGDPDGYDWNGEVHVEVRANGQRNRALRKVEGIA